MHVVDRVHRNQHVKQAQEQTNLASPLSPMADWNQLTNETLVNLMNDNRGFGIHNGWLGFQWPALIKRDLMRMYAAGKFRTVENTPQKMMWIELEEEGKSAYPALNELVKRVHALPFELNKKASLRLSVPLVSSTVVTCHEHGSPGFSPRMDGGVGAFDNGYKVTCVYFLNVDWEASSGGALRVKLQDGGEEIIEPTADKLVLLRSREVLYELLPAGENSDPLFSLIFYIHGADGNFA